MSLSRRRQRLTILGVACERSGTGGAHPHAPRDDGWPFLHPPRGTCLTGCPSYGVCHCGCGAQPERSNVNYVAGNRYRDQPFVFRSGHQHRVNHPRAGCWSRNGVEVERIRPLIFLASRTARVYPSRGVRSADPRGDRTGVCLRHQAEARSAGGRSKDRCPRALASTPSARPSV